MNFKHLLFLSNVLKFMAKTKQLQIRTNYKDRKFSNSDLMFHPDRFNASIYDNHFTISHHWQ